MTTPDVGEKFGIELNGSLAGWVSSVEGGHATSDVVSEKIGADHAGVRTHNISIHCGTGMRKGFYDWIADFIEGGHEK